MEIYRCFIALELPSNVKEELKNLQEILPKDNASLKMVEPQNLHLTLKFLGDIPEDKVQNVKDALKKFKGKKFTGIINDVGLFSENFVRVVWANLSDLNSDNDIKLLHQKIDSLCHALGFEKDKTWKPHITLTRVKYLNPKFKSQFIEKIKKIIPKQITFEVSLISFKRSKLTKKGPVYSDFLTVPLI